MAITRQKKEELVQHYSELLENSTALVFTDYRGTTVPEIQSLRTKLKENNATYAVVKNTLLGLAIEQAGHTRPDKLLDGPNAVVFLGEDIGQGVTALKDWIKSAGHIEITGGLLEGALLDAAGAASLADLPTKEQTLAMILSTINGPASSLVRMINGPASSLVRVIQCIC